MPHDKVDLLDKSIGRIVTRPLEEFEENRKLVPLVEMMHGEGSYHWIPFDRDKIQLLIAEMIVAGSKKSFLRVAELNGEFIGFMAAQVTDYFFSPAPLVQDFALYVVPQHRGSSAASRLMRDYIAWAERIGAYEACFSITADIDNDAASSFAEKHGFKRVGTVHKRRFK